MKLHFKDFRQYEEACTEFGRNISLQFKADGKDKTITVLNGVLCNTTLEWLVKNSISMLFGKE